MDLSRFVGRRVDNVKAELERLGYSVIIVENTNKSSLSSISLVVRIKLIEKGVIELVSGDFTFLS